MFVVQQLQQSQSIALNELAAMRLQVEAEWSGQVIEHADVWEAGLADEELDPVDAVIFERLLITLNDIAYIAGRNQYQLERQDYTVEVGVRDFAAFLHRNPGARRVWEERERRLEASRSRLDDDGRMDYYTEQYLAAIRATLTRLDELEE